MVKESILALLELMTEEQASDLLAYIKSSYVLVPRQSWEEAGRKAPAAEEGGTLFELEPEPDNSSFVSEADALEVLGLSD